MAKLTVVREDRLGDMVRRARKELSSGVKQAQEWNDLTPDQKEVQYLQRWLSKRGIGLGQALSHPDNDIAWWQRISTMPSLQERIKIKRTSYPKIGASLRASKWYNSETGELMAPEDAPILKEPERQPVSLAEIQRDHPKEFMDYVLENISAEEITRAMLQFLTEAINRVDQQELQTQALETSLQAEREGMKKEVEEQRELLRLAEEENVQIREEIKELKERLEQLTPEPTSRFNIGMWKRSER